MDNWRVAVLGDGGVGKTALAVQVPLCAPKSRFALTPSPSSPSIALLVRLPMPHLPPLPALSDVLDDPIPPFAPTETYDPTIEDAYRKQLVVDNRMCFVEVIDTAGQEEYATLRDQWVREGQGFILVYSIASRSTFNRLEVFRQSMRRVKRGDPIFVLVGNKCDKAYEREVSKEEGAALARQFGCEFIETSAKTAQNVERLFMNLVRSLRQTRSIESAPGGGPVRTKPKEKKGCIVL